MRRHVGTVAGALLVAALAGCKPRPDSSGTLSSAGPTPLTGIVTISGPSTIAPGSTAQFHATAKDTDGSSKDVTSIVAWSSSDTAILTVDSGGLATARQSGDITIVAVLGAGASATVTVTVIPPDTFRLQGTVSWQTLRVEGATVRVTAGTGAGLTATTDSSGAYRLYGVAGTIEVTVSEPSYVTSRKTATITGNTTLSFQLQAASPLPQFAGTYIFQISADPACVIGGPEPFPDAGRVRRYTATFDVSGGVRGRLSGADFLPDRNLIFGSLRPDGAQMDVNNLDYYGMSFYPPPDLAEILPTGDVYCPSGSFTLTASGQDFVGTLVGTLRIRRPPSGSLVAQCASANHRVSLTLR